MDNNFEDSKNKLFLSADDTADFEKVHSKSFLMGLKEEPYRFIVVVVYYL